MKIFITGASGFVGAALVAQLHKKHSITAMSRSAKSDAAIRKSGAKPVRCELGKVTVDILRSIDVVIHAAAHVEQWGDKADFWRINVIGTQQLLSAAAGAKVKRFIFISTEAALFHGQDMLNIDETYPYPKKSPYLYSETKAAAERLVLAANSKSVVGEPFDAAQNKRSRTMQTISIRPRLVWGIGDKTILPVLVDMINKSRFMWMDHGNKQTSTTNIANLVHAVELGLKQGKGGEAYFVTDGEDTTFQSFLTRYLATQNIQPPQESLPGFVVRALAFVVEAIWKLLRLKAEPPLTRFAAAIMSRHCTVKIDKICRDFGYQPVLTVAQGMQQMPAL